MDSRNQTGFTMIELMVVLAIVGILASIAYPAYTEQIRKGQRTDAKSLLLQIAAEQERFYTSNFTYTSTLSDLGFPDNAPQSENGYYTASAAIQNGGQTYTLTAAPAITDPRCANYTLTSAGARGINGGTEPVDYCW